MWEIFLSYSIYVSGAVCLFQVLKRTFGETSWMYGIAFMMNVALFSPVQYQNFMWAVQIAMLLPFACLGFILYVYQKDSWSISRKFFAVLFSALAGTLSFGHGMVLWPVAFVMPLLSKDLGSLKTRLIFAGGILAAATTTLSLYFLWNFENVSVHAYGQLPGEVPPGVKNFAAVPSEIFRFMLTAIGNPAARFFNDAISYAPKMGRTKLVILFAALGAIFYLIWKKRDRKSFEQVLPWMAIAGYAVVVTFAMAMGRSAHGWEKGIHSRYAGPGVFLGAAIVVLVGWLLLRWKESAKDSASREFRTRCALITGMVWMAFQVPIWQHSFEKIAHWKATRLQQKAALHFIKHFELRVHRRHDHALDFLTEQALFLDSKGLLSPPLAPERGFGDFKMTETNLEWKRADFSGAGITPQGLYLKGYATLKGPDRVADGVLVTYREVGSDEWEVVEMAEMTPILYSHNTAMDGVFSGSENLSLAKNHAEWVEMVPLDRLPQDKDIEIVLWAMDAAKMQLQRVNHTLTFNISQTPVGTILFDPIKVAEERKRAKELAMAE